MALAVDIRTARTGGNGSRYCSADQDVAAGLGHRGLVTGDGDSLVRIVDVLVLGNGLVDGCLLAGLPVGFRFLSGQCLECHEIVAVQMCRIDGELDLNGAVLLLRSEGDARAEWVTVPIGEGGAGGLIHKRTGDGMLDTCLDIRVGDGIGELDLLADLDGVLAVFAGERGADDGGIGLRGLLHLVIVMVLELVLATAVAVHKALQEELNMGRMWRGWYRRFHPIGDRMGNEMVDTFDVGQPICDLDMKYGVYKVPAKEVIPYRIYPVLSPVWKADGYDELGIIYDRYLDLLVTYVVEGESETDGYAAAIVTYDNLDTFDLPRGKLFEYASRNLKSDIRIGFTGITGQLAMLEIGRLSGGVGGASALLLSSVWESAVKLLGTEKIIFFALSNCELMAVVAEERIIHALKSGLFDAARESVPVEEYFPKSIYGLVSDRSGYCLHRF